MGRFRTDYPYDFLPSRCLHLNSLRKKAVAPPPPYRNHFKKTIGENTLNPETDLIHMTRDHYPRSTPTPAVNRSAAIAPDLTMLLEFLDKNFPHLILIAGNTMRLGQSFQ